MQIKFSVSENLNLETKAMTSLLRVTTIPAGCARHCSLSQQQKTSINRARFSWSTVSNVVAGKLSSTTQWSMKTTPRGCYQKQWSS